MDIPILFGRFLLNKGIISKDKLSYALKVQSEINNSFLLTTLEGGYVKIEALKDAINLQRDKGLCFKDALMELKLIDEETIEKIKGEMAEKRIMLGDLIVKQGIITSHELEDALKEFHEHGKH